MMPPLRLLSLCSGIGGADLAAEWTGAIEVVGQVEIDPFCQQVLATHWPHVKRLNDIKEVQGDEFGAIDLVVGGIPCQPFSGAGKQRGSADDRYLWPDMFRIVQRCQPAWVVLENVADFTYMALDIVQADLESQGYAVQAFVLPACAVGAPHLRERCFVVAHTNGLGELRTQSTRAYWQRSPTFSTGVHQWSDPARQTTSLEKRTHRASADPTTTKEGPFTHRVVPQSYLGRMLDGLSSRLDALSWPALPGHAPKRGEPARTVSVRHPSIDHRLKALGNAIVPAQIFPLFQIISAWEVGKDEE